MHWRLKGEISGSSSTHQRVLLLILRLTLSDLDHFSASLSQVHALAQYIADRSATIGVGLEHCHLPGSKPDGELHQLGTDEVELGMGIHVRHHSPNTLFQPSAESIGFGRTNQVTEDRS